MREMQMVDSGERTPMLHTIDEVWYTHKENNEYIF